MCVTGEWRSYRGRTGACGSCKPGAAGAWCGAWSMMRVILTRLHWRAGRLRRCVPPVPTVRRCLPFCLAPPALPLAPARRGYGYGSGGAVADGTAGVPVRPCQGSYAPLPRRAGTANWASVRTASLPPARRGYGYVAGMPVVRGTAGVPVRVCQGSYAPPCPPGVGTACRAMVQPCPARPAASRFLSNKRNRRFTERRVVWRRDRARKMAPSAIH